MNLSDISVVRQIEKKMILFSSPKYFLSDVKKVIFNSTHIYFHCIVFVKAFLIRKIYRKH